MCMNYFGRQLMEVWEIRINKSNKNSGSINYSNDPVSKQLIRKITSVEFNMLTIINLHFCNKEDK